MPGDLFPAHDHDHDTCTQSLIAHVEKACAQRGLRLTPLRREVLFEVAASHKAIGAYQILENFAERGKHLAPISVYRCLEFLQKAGFIHHLPSKNSYFACQRSFTKTDEGCGVDPLVFLICSSCGVIGEVDGQGMENLVTDYATARGFQKTQSQLEINGLCPRCQQTACT